jgi:hypothetical protein
MPNPWNALLALDFLKGRKLSSSLRCFFLEKMEVMELGKGYDIQA